MNCPALYCAPYPMADLFPIAFAKEENEFFNDLRRFRKVAVSSPAAIPASPEDAA